MQLRSTLCAVMLALATTAASAGDDSRKVVCVSQNRVNAACDGVVEAIRHAEFFKRWPADHAIAVTTQSIKLQSASAMVTAGTLQVVRVVHEGKLIGMKPVYVIQMSRETTNLEDGAPEDLAAKNIGWSLANRLNKAIASGETADR